MEEMRVTDKAKSAFEDLLEIPPLPSASDKLFTTDSDWWNHACLNWSHAKWDLYASGYKDAADILVSNERRQDSLVYPIMFLYRQYLELAIKDLIQDARRLQSINEGLPTNHRIDQLWRTCHKLLAEIAPGDSDDSLKHIGRLIDEFSAIDPTSFAFRYPEAKDGTPTLSGITRINLRIVKEVIGKISMILGGAAAMVGEHLSWKAEMEQEFRQEY